MTTKNLPKKKPFEKMTPSEKRVTIAQDVLDQLESKRLLASPGTWVANEEFEFYVSKGGAPVESLFCTQTGKKKKCNVCAMGALFVCAVERADELKVEDLSNTWVSDESTKKMKVNFEEEDVFEYMDRFFERDQLDAIETAFERGAGGTFHSDLAEGFAGYVEDASERMRLIMENIVANNGTFKFSVNYRPVETTIFRTPGYGDTLVLPPLPKPARTVR